MSKKLKTDRQLKSSNFCIPPPHTPPPPMTETCVFRKSVLRWEPANATGFSSRTRVPRYHYLGVLVL